MIESSPFRAPAFVALTALWVYGLALYPSVPPGDSGEIVAALWSGGVIHPPGHPLYEILAKPFVWLPVGTVAWRLELLSAVAAACPVFLIAIAVAEWTRNSKAGLLAAGLFAFSTHVFSCAVGAEVFALAWPAVDRSAETTIRNYGLIVLEEFESDRGRSSPRKAARSVDGRSKNSSGISR